MSGPTLVANTARGVRQDCELAARELPDPPSEAWRRRWVALIALLRTVGNVLAKTDYKNGDAALRRAIRAAWAPVARSKPAPPIFWGFIKAKRDGVLKTYTLMASQSVTLGARPQVVMTRGGGGVTQVGPRLLAIYTATMATGPFKGQKPIEVARQAIEWWRGHLDGSTPRPRAFTPCRLRRPAGKSVND